MEAVPGVVTIIPIRRGFGKKPIPFIKQSRGAFLEVID
jgi:hypothetical protein